MGADDYSEPWKKVDGVIEWLHIVDAFFT